MFFSFFSFFIHCWPARLSATNWSKQRPDDLTQIQARAKTLACWPMRAMMPSPRSRRGHCDDRLWCVGARRPCLWPTRVRRPSLGSGRGRRGPRLWSVTSPANSVKEKKKERKEKEKNSKKNSEKVFKKIIKFFHVNVLPPRTASIHISDFRPKSTE